MKKIRVSEESLSSNILKKPRRMMFVCLLLVACFVIVQVFISSSAKIESFSREHVSMEIYRIHNTDVKCDGPVKKPVYLTFDDGPTYGVTARILDVLKEEEVKATFFVVGKEINGKEDILRRIYKEGHSIGLHTYSHDFKKIYKDKDSFIYEMKKTSYAIKEVLGITPTAVRFPGGSDRILNSELLERLHDENLRVFDWNVNIGDGINAHSSPERLLKNSQKIKGKSRIIILAHCNSNNKNTYKALPAIIHYYRNAGYEFDSIKDSTPEYYYRFRK